VAEERTDVFARPVGLGGDAQVVPEREERGCDAEERLGGIAEEVSGEGADWHCDREHNESHEGGKELDQPKRPEALHGLKGVRIDGRNRPEESCGKDDESGARDNGDARHVVRHGECACAERQRAQQGDAEKDAAPERFELAARIPSREIGRFLGDGHTEGEEGQREDCGGGRDGQDRAEFARRDELRHEPHARDETDDVPRPEGDEQEPRVPHEWRGILMIRHDVKYIIYTRLTDESRK